MSDLGSPNGNGESDEDREWREHVQRFDAVQALERRLGSLETAVREGFKDVATKFKLVLDGIQELRDESRGAHKQWVQLTDRRIEIEKRVAVLEARRGRKKK